MKILIASLFFPQVKATHAGGRLVAELVRELSKTHEVHLAARAEETELDAVADMQPYCKGLSVFPYKKVASRGFLTSMRLVASYVRFGWQVNKIIQSSRFDLVQAEWVEAGMFLKRCNVPMVLDAHDVITKPAWRNVAQSRGVKRLLAYLIYRVVRFLELRTVRKFDVILTRAEYDRQYLCSMTKDAEIEVLPHPAGLDITGKTYAREENTILFLASFKHRKLNVDAALYFYQEVFPKVRARIPGAKFIIAGYGPPEKLLSLQNDDSGVKVTGFVEDIEECYKKAAVFVAPILVGGGVIVKVLDAMAAGVPVVTTSFGNEGIGAKPGHDIIIADSPEVFATEVVRILSDRRYADSVSKSGQEYIREHFSTEAVFGILESVYKRLHSR